MSRILVTGGSGLFAVNWALHSRTEHDFLLGFHQKKIQVPGVETFTAETGDENYFYAQLETLQPDMVINTIALTDVERCEADPPFAESVNVDTALKIGAACIRAGIPFVHISSDHLFGGTTPFATEETPVAPLNVYGASKARADKAVLDQNPAAIIVRTNFFGWGTSYRYSFSDRILASLRKGQALNLFHDVFFTPILIDELGSVIIGLVNQKMTGIYNVVGNDRISKLEFGLRLADRFMLDKRLINPAPFESMKGLVQRPKDMSLSNSKVSAALSRNMGSLDTYFDRLFEQEQNGFAETVRSIC